MTKRADAYAPTPPDRDPGFWAIERMAWDQDMRDGEGIDRGLWIVLHTIGLPIYLGVSLQMAIGRWFRHRHV
jgi:hypothetical protein